MKIGEAVRLGEVFFFGVKWGSMGSMRSVWVL